MRYYSRELLSRFDMVNPYRKTHMFFCINQCPDAAVYGEVEHLNI